MQILRQSTSATLKLGPFLDDVDGVTPENGLSIVYTDIKLSKNGGAFGSKSDTSSGAIDANGWYSVPINTTDTATLGRLLVACNMTGAVPVWAEYMVVTTNVYDTFFSTDILNVNVEQWNTTNVPSEDTAGYPKVTIKDGTGQGEIDTTSGGVKVATYASGAITSSALASGAIDAFWDEIVEGTTLTGRQALRLLVAVLAGNSTGGGTSTLRYRDFDDTKDRVIAVMDGDNNRTVTLDET